MYICRYGKLKCSICSTVGRLVALYANMTWNPTKLNSFPSSWRAWHFSKLWKISAFLNKVMVINSLQTGHRIGKYVEPFWGWKSTQVIKVSAPKHIEPFWSWKSTQPIKGSAPKAFFRDFKYFRYGPRFDCEPISTKLQVNVPCSHARKMAISKMLKPVPLLNGSP